MPPEVIYPICLLPDGHRLALALAALSNIYHALGILLAQFSQGQECVYGPPLSECLGWPIAAIIMSQCNCGEPSSAIDFLVPESPRLELVGAFIRST